MWWVRLSRTPLFNKRATEFLMDKSHFFLGEQSGYSLCCILWFKLRWALMVDSKFKKYFNKYWSTKHKIKDRLGIKSKFYHILCPFCWVKYQFKPFQYFKCYSCDWTQFQKQCCNLCGDENTEKFPKVFPKNSDK